MKKSRKTSLLVISIISAVFVAAAIVLFFLIPTLLKTGGSVAELLEPLAQAYKIPFSNPGVDKQVLTICIINLVFTALVFVAFVLGIVLVSVKKRPCCIWVMFLFVLAGFPATVLIVLGHDFFEMIKLFLEAKQTGHAMVFLAIVICAIVGFILALVAYILALVFASKTAKEAAERTIDEDVSVIGENGSDPEIVEEGKDELDYAAPEVLAAPVVEPEPVEPEPEPEVEEPAPEEPVAEEPVEEPVEEPAPEPAEESELVQEPAPEPQKVEVNVNNNAAPAAQPGIDQASLASLLREVVRDIVRDEIARSNVNQPQPAQPAQGGNQTITGATFGGPLVVQYFNGGINGVNPFPAPAAQPAPAPAPVQVVEQPKPEPQPQPEPAPAPVEEEPVVPEPAPEPVVEEVKPEEPQPEPAPEQYVGPVVEIKPEVKYERISFAERLLKSEKDVHNIYNEIKNEILSWGVKSRVSANGDTFRLHKKMYVRITVAGKSLKLYFALDPKDYADTTLPIQDASSKEMYQDIPLVFKVKSGLSVRRCKDLIKDCMIKDGLTQGEVGKVNWIKELKAEMAAAKKAEKEEK